MAQSTITGTIDKKAVPQSAHAKVQDALKSALGAEFIHPGTHHLDFTHINIVIDKA